MYFDKNSSYIVFVPGAGWVTKRWPTEHFAELANLIVTKYKKKIILVGAKSDAILAEEILQKTKVPEYIINLIGKTNLQELIAVMNGAKAIISNDSGPMHIAAAVNSPVLALFGPTSDIKTGPYGEKNRVITADESCRPCFKKSCQIEMVCLKNILPSLVFQYLQKQENLL